jgi:hypothetical protein
MNLLKHALAALSIILWASAAPAQMLSCPLPAKSMVRAELLFGRNIGGRLGVTERKWTRFLAREIAPRFPDGLTVLDGTGQWRDPDRGVTVHERSKIVIVVTPDDSASRERLLAVIDAYKRRFRQKSVGLVTRPVCAAF